MIKKVFRISLWIVLGIVLVTIVPIGFSLFTEQATAIQKNPDYKKLKEGDLIFQTSTSNQSSFISIGTQSNVTHCGIIVFRNGQPYVYEASRTVKLTPLMLFIKRGKERKYWIKRPKFEIKKVNCKYLHMPYDMQFKFNNGKMYCSELIYIEYKEQFGIELCKPKKVSDYLILGSKYITKLKNEIKKRGIILEQEAIAPVDVFNSEYLQNISL